MHIKDPEDPPDWLRVIVLDSSVAYLNAVMRGLSLQEAELQRLAALKKAWKHYINGE